MEGAGGLYSNLSLDTDTALFLTTVLDKFLNLFDIGFLICKFRIMGFTSWVGCEDYVRKLGEIPSTE